MAKVHHDPDRPDLVLTDRRPETYAVIARQGNRAGFLPPQRIGPRSSALILALDLGSAIRGRILSPDGRPASRATVHLTWDPVRHRRLGLTLGREERANGSKSSVIYPGEVNTPILDRRPVPVPAERRAAILQPEDVAAAVHFLAELPERATVPELVITPAADEFF